MNQKVQVPNDLGTPSFRYQLPLQLFVYHRRGPGQCCTRSRKTAGLCLSLFNIFHATTQRLGMQNPSA